MWFSADVREEVRASAADKVAGDLGEPQVAGAGVIAQQLEGLVHVDAQPLGELTLGLLDDDPAGQGGLKLLGDRLAAPHVPLVQQADRGHISQRLADAQVCLAQRPRAGAEQVKRADDLITQPHRQRLHRLEPGTRGRGRKPRPALIWPGEVGRGDRTPSAEAVQARALVILDLEQLDQPGRLAGRRRYPQLTAWVGQHDPGR